MPCLCLVCLLWFFCIFCFSLSVTSAQAAQAGDLTFSVEGTWLSQYQTSSVQQCVGNLMQVLSICAGYMPGNGKADGKFFRLSAYHFSKGVEFF